MRMLRRTQFGNPILRTPARRLEKSEITSVKTQELIRNMLATLEHKKYGVGLAAPQVGIGVALAVLSIKPTPTRPQIKSEQLVIINPEIVKTYGRRTGMWEGCISFGDVRNFPYAKALRYRKIRLRYHDGQGRQHERDFDGLLAHVLQHEVDHLNGILFVDRVRDPKTFMNVSEFKKRYLLAG